MIGGSAEEVCIRLGADFGVEGAPIGDFGYADGIIEVGEGGGADAGGAALLTDETNGFAMDFTHSVDAERVAVKVAGTATAHAAQEFIANAGTSPKLVYGCGRCVGLVAA